MTDGDSEGDETPADPRQGPTDPRAVTAVVVHAGDVVAAIERNRRGGAEGRAVLRVTPPFEGRMRARIHVDQGVDEDPLHLPPERLVADPPPLPEPDDTADALRADPAVEYTRERHRRRHEAAVAEWRETVRERIADEVHLAGDHAVDVVVIGEG